MSIEHFRAAAHAKLAGAPPPWWSPPRDKFKSFYLAEWIEDPAWEKAVVIVARYEVGCETYDRTICTGGIDPVLGAIPATWRERSLIGAHANTRWREAVRQALEAGIGSGMLERARRHVSRFNFEACKEIVARADAAQRGTR